MAAEQPNKQLSEITDELRELNGKDPIGDIADAIKDQGKENKLAKKEEQSERNMFFKNLLGDFKSSFKDVRSAVVAPVKDKSIWGIAKMLLAAIPAIGIGLVAGFLGPIASIFSKLPFMGKLITAFKGVMSFFAKILAPVIRFLKPIIATVGKLLAPVLKILGKGGSFAKMFGIFFKFGKILGKLVWPITVIIAAVQGAIAAVKEWQAGGSIVAVIGKFFAGVVDSLTFGLYDSDKSIGENFSGLIVWIGELFGSIGNWVRSIGPTVLGWIDSGIMHFKNFLDSVVFWVQYDLPGFIATSFDNIIWFFTTGLPQMVSDLWTKLTDFFTGDGFMNMIGAIWAFLKEIPMMFVDVWASVLGFIWGFVKGIGSTLMGVLTDIVMWLGVKVLEIQASILEYIDETLGILSPFGGLAESARENAELAHKFNEARKAENALLAEEERKLAEEQRELKQAEAERVRQERAAERDEKQKLAMAKYATPQPSPTGTGLREETARASATALPVPPVQGGAVQNNNLVTHVENNAYSQPPLNPRNTNNPFLLGA